jgi:phosphatidylglycerol:prolipoprotein diacylglycerol transferase
MHPYIVVGGQRIVAWAALVATGVVLSWVLLLRRTHRLGYRRLPVFLWVLLAFPVGALFANDVAAGLVLAAFGQSGWAGRELVGNGLTVLGAIFACLTFSAIYIRLVFGEAPWRLLDAVAFTFPLSMIFGRVGCLLNGCCFGRVAPRAMPPLTVAAGAYEPSTAAAELHRGLPPETPIWNLPLALIASEIIVLVVVEWAWRRRARLGLGDGAVVCLAVALDSAFRFVLEWTRGEQAMVGGGWATPWQIVAGLFAVVAAAGFVVRVRSGRRVALEAST